MHRQFPASRKAPFLKFHDPHLSSILALVICSGIAGPRLRAAETLLLPETVVTASRTDEDSLQSMSSIGVVTAAQFQ